MENEKVQIIRANYDGGRGKKLSEDQLRKPFCTLRLNEHERKCIETWAVQAGYGNNLAAFVRDELIFEADEKVTVIPAVTRAVLNELAVLNKNLAILTHSNAASDDYKTKLDIERSKDLLEHINKQIMQLKFYQSIKATNINTDTKVATNDTKIVTDDIESATNGKLSNLAGLQVFDNSKDALFVNDKQLSNLKTRSSNITKSLQNKKNNKGS